MVVPWADPRCIVCLNVRDLDEEHIIPKVVGGRLKCSFLCKHCNNTFGTDLDARLKDDPQIRKAALDLSQELPGLAGSIEEGAAYMGKTAYGEVQGTVRNGEFRPRALRPSDGSLMLSTPEAREAIIGRLKKEGRAAEIPAAVE